MDFGGSRCQKERVCFDEKFTDFSAKSDVAPRIDVDICTFSTRINR